MHRLCRFWNTTQMKTRRSEKKMLVIVFFAEFRRSGVLSINLFKFPSAIINTPMVPKQMHQLAS